MKKDLHAQIYENFNREETETLLEIWERNDRSEWSDTAFEVLEKILLERLHELPPQNEANYGTDKDEDLDIFSKFKEWFSVDEESKYLLELDEIGDGPVFYNPYEVQKTYLLLNKIAKAMIPISILLGLVMFPQTLDIVQSYFINSFNDMTIVVWLFALLTMGVGFVLQIASTYYPLKALAYILKILMQFEHNSRR